MRQEGEIKGEGELRERSVDLYPRGVRHDGEEEQGGGLLHVEEGVKEKRSS